MNLCIFTGRLTANAETKFLPTGTAITNFTIAVDTGFGEHKRTEFIRCMAWKKEKLAEHMTKGKPITVSGEYKKRQWEDKEGNKRETVEIVVNHIEFQQDTPAGQRAGTQSEPQPYSSSPVKTFDEDADQIPF